MLYNTWVERTNTLTGREPEIHSPYTSTPSNPFTQKLGVPTAHWQYMQKDHITVGKFHNHSPETVRHKILDCMVYNLIRRGFNKTKVNFQCIELLLIEQFLMTRYRHIGIFGESEGDHSTTTNLEI